MYIWNGKKLAKVLAKNELSELEKIKYLLLGSIFYITTNYFNFYVFPIIDNFYYFEYFLIILITIAGVLVCFKKHGGNAQKGFIENFICLTVPVLVKMYLFVWLPYALFYRFVNPIELGWSKEFTANVFNVSQSSLAVSSDVFFYILMAYYLKLTNEYR